MPACPLQTVASESGLQIHFDTCKHIKESINETFRLYCLLSVKTRAPKMWKVYKADALKFFSFNIYILSLPWVSVPLLLSWKEENLSPCTDAVGKYWVMVIKNLSERKVTEKKIVLYSIKFK